jgi:hypothetical protein
MLLDIQALGLLNLKLGKIMNVPPNDSLFWPFARQVILCSLLCGFGAFAYQNKMSMTDFVMIGSAMASIFGLDIFKRTVNTSNKD